VIAVVRRPKSDVVEMTQWRAGVTLLIGVVFGWLIWMFSPWLGGHVEPWDGEPLYFISSLFLAGFAFGIVVAARSWIGVFGVYIGQLLTVYCRIFSAEYLTGTTNGSPPAGGGYFGGIPVWFPAIILLVYCVLTLVGALFGWLIRTAWTPNQVSRTRRDS
jgi:hypothetical protein